MTDPFDLDRFVQAQAAVYPAVLAELAWRGIETFSLSKASLEDVYLELTAEALEA